MYRWPGASEGYRVFGSPLPDLEADHGAGRVPSPCLLMPSRSRVVAAGLITQAPSPFRAAHGPLELTCQPDRAESVGLPSSATSRKPHVGPSRSSSLEDNLPGQAPKILPRQERNWSRDCKFPIDC